MELRYELLIKNNALGSEYIVEKRYFETIDSLIEALSLELKGGFILSDDTIQVINLEERNGREEE